MELSDSRYSAENIYNKSRQIRPWKCVFRLCLKRHQEDVDFYTEISSVNQKLGEINLALTVSPPGHTLDWKGTICIRSRRKLGKGLSFRWLWSVPIVPGSAQTGITNVGGQVGMLILLPRKGCVTWLLPSVQVTRCLHPLQKSAGIRGQGPANPEDARSAKAPASRAGRRDCPYHGGFWTERWENFIWKLL